MKIILTGGTGFVGSEVLRRLVDDPEVTHDFTLALGTLTASTGRPFTFCYLSGAGADPEEDSKIPWERVTRHLKGRTEKDLRALGERHPAFTVHCFRPAGILPLGTSAAAS